ncbi:MAG: FhaA domain-containing protein [Acidobacteriota bacterium]
MADKSESALDKAEGVARRILDRLGAKLDSRLAPASQHMLGARQISDLTTRIERAIESNLKTAETGAARVAPNRFRVLLTYEETSSLTAEYMEAVSKELTNTVHEYINNRRYKTPGPIVVEVSRDVFAKTVLVKADFSAEPDQSSKGQSSGIATGQASPNPAATTTVILIDAQGNEHRIVLSSNGSPACIGRTAGNTTRIDDASISRIHCSLAIKGSGEVVVADLGSANGTFVNDAPLAADEARKLTPGDVIRLGDLALTVSRFV